MAANGPAHSKSTISVLDAADNSETLSDPPELDEASLHDSEEDDDTSIGTEETP